jgi:hypothetical protein
MDITLKVRKALLIESMGADQLDLYLESPSPFPNLGDAGTATIRTAKGYGAQWCRENLGVEPEVIKG